VPEQIHTAVRQPHVGEQPPRRLTPQAFSGLGPGPHRLDRQPRRLRISPNCTRSPGSPSTMSIARSSIGPPIRGARPPVPDHERSAERTDDPSTEPKSAYVAPSQILQDLTAAVNAAPRFLTPLPFALRYASATASTASLPARTSPRTWA
jgi:hypothetical protein